jgi:hypothetical protein
MVPMMSAAVLSQGTLKNIDKTLVMMDILVKKNSRTSTSTILKGSSSNSMGSYVRLS